MAEKLDWLIGEYWMYQYRDIDSPIFGYPCNISKAKNGQIIANWSYGPKFDYEGSVSIMGGNINVLSKRNNHQDVVLAIFPKPNTEYINLLWGVAAGTLERGNLPAAYRVLKSREQLTNEQVNHEFAEAGVTPQNGLFVIDYNSEAENERPVHPNNLEDITQLLIDRSPKARQLLSRMKNREKHE